MTYRQQRRNRAMKVNRRKFLQGTAAAAAAGAFPSSAWAEDPISVASIHDLSGGLDIYGKPMVDALTLAVEEANAAGGLLGRQIKLTTTAPRPTWSFTRRLRSRPGWRTRWPSCMAA